MNFQQAPIIRVDTDLPALPAEALNADFLRRCFKAPPKEWAFSKDDGIALKSPQHVRSAAVLIAILKNPLLPTPTPSTVYGGSEPYSILFMQRSSWLKDHAGQVSLPGGKVDHTDANVFDAALRETQEEVGIDPSKVEVLGSLPTYTTGTSFEITPVVGLIKEPQQLLLSKGEVASAFTVPLSFLMTPANHRWHEYSPEKNGEKIKHRWLSMEYTQQGHTYLIWGATAAMLRNLYYYLNAKSIEVKVKNEAVCG